MKRIDSVSDVDASSDEEDAARGPQSHGHVYGDKKSKHVAGGSTTRMRNNMHADVNSSDRADEDESANRDDDYSDSQPATGDATDVLREDGASPRSPQTMRRSHSDNDVPALASPKLTETEVRVYLLHVCQYVVREGHTWTIICRRWPPRNSLKQRCVLHTHTHTYTHISGSTNIPEDTQPRRF